MVTLSSSSRAHNIRTRNILLSVYTFIVYFIVRLVISRLSNYSTYMYNITLLRSAEWYTVNYLPKLINTLLQIRRMSFAETAARGVAELLKDAATKRNKDHWRSVARYTFRETRNRSSATQCRVRNNQMDSIESPTAFRNFSISSFSPLIPTFLFRRSIFFPQSI